MKLIPKKYKKYMKLRYWLRLANQLKFMHGKVSLDSLTDYNIEKYNKSKILFGFSSRFKDNFNSFLDDAVDSIYKNANNPDLTPVLGATNIIAKVLKKLSKNNI